MITEHFSATDGHTLVVHRQHCEAEKGVVLILHGMAEHGARYKRLAHDLNSIGISLVAPDLRGHGETSRLNGVRGSFGDGGRQRVLEDIEELFASIQNDHPNKPIFLLGHSMGSMLAMRVAQRQKVHPTAIVLSAFPTHPGALVLAGKIMGKIMSRISGPDTPSKFMDNLTFGKFSRGIANRRTDFDWLSRNAKEVDAYIADPDCGEVFCNRFFYELASLTDDAYKSMHLLPAELPLMYIAGGDDPVVGKAKGFEKVAARIRAVSPKMTCKNYPGGRHELLNDTCRDEVVADLQNFYAKHL